MVVDIKYRLKILQIQYSCNIFNRHVLQLHMTLYVAEWLLPDYMVGLSQLYNSSHIHKYRAGEDNSGDDGKHDSNDHGDGVYCRHSKHKGGTEKLSTEARKQMEER